MDSTITLLCPVILLLIVPVLLILFLHKKQSPKPKLPPGPPKLPLIGNLHQVGKLPHHSLWQLSQQHGPLLYLQLGQAPTIIISSSEMARQVLRTHDLESCSRPSLFSSTKLSYGCSDVVFIPHGDKWRELRKTCMVELFGTKNNSTLQSIREEEVESMNIFVAGSDTSSASLEWTMAELMRNPEAMKKAQDEVRRVIGMKGKVEESDLQQLQYLKWVLKESMRLHPPAPLLVHRETTQRFKINGYEIQPKTRVIVNAWAIGRETSSWERPLEFYPERFRDSSIDMKGHDFQLIPFGAGRRICPGMHLGIQTVELALANLLYTFDWKCPDGSQDINMDETPGVTVHKKYPLFLVPIKYELK
ncbi:Cytochrome P450 E-class group I protein [Dioscorea alata]|uniref:Cytochrome P450 E-class group I protein n=1 Tax=Dioscorea alata TaxID=55571 RepID=A0ACB7UP43_DIOAL|nr:Cytochrome P450 E-class group I protein [Dioscorea alata]